MLKRKNLQFGFTLLEVLVASFIFASVLAVVYALLNDTLISKKDLELTLTVNEQVKNANEVLQTVMREASGDFFTDGEFKTTAAATQDPNFTTAHLFFVSNQAITLNNLNVSAPSFTAANGGDLYVKVLEDGKPKIYLFSFNANVGELDLYSWKKVGNDWIKDQDKTLLLKYNPNIGLHQFSVPKNTDKNQQRSVYQPNLGKLTPMALFVQLQVTAISNWKATTYEREMNQTYVPLITSNPYL